MEVLTKLAPDNLIKFLDILKESTAANEPLRLQEFNAHTEQERNCIVIMMDLVVKLGELENASDLDKRRHCYQLISNKNL